MITDALAYVAHHRNSVNTAAEMELHETKRGRIVFKYRQNSRQRGKHGKLYSSLFQALNKKEEEALKRELQCFGIFQYVSF